MLFDLKMFTIAAMLMVFSLKTLKYGDFVPESLVNSYFGLSAVLCFYHHHKAGSDTKSIF